MQWFTAMLSKKWWYTEDKTVKSFLSVYLAYLKMHFRSRVEYRFNFIAGIITNIYSYFITFISFWVIVQHFGAIDGWSFEEMCILYALNIFPYSIAGMFFWTVFGLEFEITSGNFDLYLTRPMGVIQQTVCKKYVDTFIGQVFITGVFSVLAVSRLDLHWTVGKIVYLIAAVISGIFMHAGAMILFGGLAFWLKRTLSLAGILYYGLRNFTQYPLSIFPMLLRMLLTFLLPWAFINYYPALIILNRSNSELDTILGYIAPLTGIIFFLISMLVFYAGLRKYESSGS